MPEAVRWWPLGVLAVGAAALAWAGVVPRWAGVVHAVALPPFDLAFDLRVLVARAPSYAVLGAGVAGTIAVRAALLAALLFGLEAVPSFGAGLVRALRLYVAAAVPMVVAAALGFAGLASVYAWYAWAGLALTLLVGIPLAIRLAPRFSRLRRIPWVLGAVLGLALVGGGARLAGPAVAPALVPVSAVVTGFVLFRLLGLAREPKEPRYVPKHAAVLVTLALLLLAGTLQSKALQQPAAPNASLLLVPGVDTASGQGALYRLDPSALGFPCERVFYFSYRGVAPGDVPAGEARCPIRLHRPYRAESTQRPLAELVGAFAEQVAAIREDTGGAPLVVVTHSQGAVVAWRAVAEGRAAGVTHVVGLAGFPSSPVGYPPPRTNGSGRAGADFLRVLSWISRFIGGGRFDPDAPLGREILARPDGLESVFGQPLPAGVSATLVFASADLVVAPEGHALPHGSTQTIDTTHVDITMAPEAAAAVRRALAGDAPSGGTLLAAFLDAVLPAFVPPPADA